MNKNRPYIVGIALIIILGVMLISSKTKKQPSNTNSANSASSSNTVTSPNSNPADVVAGLYKNPISNNSTTEGFVIKSGLVENNIDASGKVTDDHLELSLTNTTKQDLSNFELYYTITDLTTNKKEGYYKQLTGFTLPTGKTESIHFDNGTGMGHFSVNKNSLYYKSANKLEIDVMISAPNYKVQTIKLTKDAGGAETQD